MRVETPTNKPNCSCLQHESCPICRPEEFEEEYRRTGINAFCDWCGGYVHCPICEDSAVHKRMNSDEIDDPMDEAQGGHIHWCSLEHLVFWTDAHYWTEHEEHVEEDGSFFAPGCECHEKREALLCDVGAGMQDDATEEERKLAAKSLAGRSFGAATATTGCCPRRCARRCASTALQKITCQTPRWTRRIYEALASHGGGDTAVPKPPLTWSCSPVGEDFCMGAQAAPNR